MSYVITQNSGTSDVGASFGYDTTVLEKRAQSFTTIGAGTVTSADVCCAKSGTPGNHAILQVWTDSGGLPGTQVGSSSNAFNPTVTYSGGVPFSTPITVTFGTPVSVSAATKYHLVYARDDALSTTNYYVIDQGTTSGGDTSLYASGSWTHPNSFAYNASVSITTVVAATGSSTLTMMGV
jgi:hypothetical protein